jgi:hypothetical protein
MALHILISKATRRSYKEKPQIPENAAYDLASGFWTIEGKPLVSSNNFHGVARVSKKCDQETGEDQKGE